ncbi:hypothetical protein SEA_OCTOBIEN14_32 [Gordonia phage Octobien14]|uniref:LtfC/p132/Gp6 beta-sandwich domain-containing protein n=1 Tax=Gordonia phage Octobien14 TaxID=2483673 RepID=A0A3G3M9J5_9CAUD|nr:hypothetical protein L3Y22_gp032 [Gordonia phage Octobien14]AYR03180.1 hypothetical protein SEA_OCTOBIEN14_32 [Gordonia phage Octobien14]
MANLGYDPMKGKILLSKGADWVCTLSTGDVWPAGTTVWAQVGDLAPWNAAVTESTGTAAFRVESTITDEVEDRTPYTIYLRFPGSPSTEFAWFEDQVRRTRK